MTDYCTLDDVKTRLAGDDPAQSGYPFSDNFDQTITAKISEVSQDIDRLVRNARGIKSDWSFVADLSSSARSYWSRGGALLPIDDCVEIDAVALIDTQGNVQQTLTNPADYITEPMQGTPFVSLRRIGWWPRGGIVRVTAKWGYGLAVPYDVREACILETIRAYLSDRTGNDDRLGLTPFGTVITAKAYTSKVMEMVNDYSFGGGFLR